MTTKHGNTKNEVLVAEAWIVGDFVYAAIKGLEAPGGTATRLVGRSEYPIARVAPLDCKEYSFVRWVKRDEQ